MRNNLKKTILLLVVAALVGGSFLFGIRIGEQNPKVLIVKGVSGVDADTKNADFSVFWQAWQTIEENYVKEKNGDKQDWVYGAIKGLVGALGDPHSEFFTPAENEKFEEDVTGRFGGIGIEIGIRQGTLTVIAPLKGTPAMEAGIKAGDLILEINSSSTEGITISEAVQKIRGPRGTKVNLLMYRDSWDKPRDFTITRDFINVPTLDLTMKEGNIAYLQLYSFNALAGSLFDRAAVDIVRNGTKGIVLDLRNDPGGFLDVAVEIAGWFLEPGDLVVKEATRSGDGLELFAEGNGALKDIPTVVIINEGSASAAEILAGTLRDNNGVKLVGEKSFGKGTVQQIFPLKDDSTIKLTIANWVLPSGLILEGSGLKPDYEVKMGEDDSIGGSDPQLDKALELLKS